MQRGSLFLTNALRTCERRTALARHFQPQSFRRAMSELAQPGTGSLRTQLTAELKTAMKARDSSTSTILRSVLSEVYAADKMTSDGEKIADGAIVGLMRKGIQKRADAAAQFSAADRADLAQKEEAEAALLQRFLPPILSESDVDAALKAVLAEGTINPADGKKVTGQLFKAFYARVPKENVDADLVKRRMDALLASAA